MSNTDAHLVFNSGNCIVGTPVNKTWVISLTRWSEDGDRFSGFGVIRHLVSAVLLYELSFCLQGILNQSNIQSTYIKQPPPLLSVRGTLNQPYTISSRKQPPPLLSVRGTLNQPYTISSRKQPPPLLSVRGTLNQPYTISSRKQPPPLLSVYTSHVKQYYPPMLLLFLTVSPKWFMASVNPNISALALCCSMYFLLDSQTICLSTSSFSLP